jgi:hypothetical protein
VPGLGVLCQRRCGVCHYLHVVAGP